VAGQPEAIGYAKTYREIRYPYTISSGSSMIISAVTDIYLVRTLHDLARQWWPDIHPMVLMAAS
jgi:hypothetical protein